jgi:hypothetical protein
MTSATAYEVATNASFQKRVEFFLIKKAAAVLATNPAAGSANLILGQRVLDREEPIFAWSIAVMTNATIFAGAHSSSGDTISDGDLEFTVNSFWDTFAK